MTGLEWTLILVVVIESACLLTIWIVSWCEKSSKREADEVVREIRIGDCERAVKNLQKRVKSLEEQAADDADEEEYDEESELVIPLSMLQRAFSTEKQKPEEEKK